MGPVCCPGKGSLLFRGIIKQADTPEEENQPSVERSVSFNYPDAPSNRRVVWTLNSAHSLRALRQTKRLTVSELARRSGLARRTLTYWEAGTSLPCIPELKAVLNALKATPEEAAPLIALLHTPRGLRLAKVERTVISAEGVAAVGMGDLLRSLRVRHDLTQEQLAARLQINRQSVLRWEAGQTLISGEHLERLCDLLHTAPEERQALRAHRLTMPHWAEEDWQRVTVEESSHFWHTMQQSHHILSADYHPPSPLFELQVMAVKRLLYLHTRHGTEIRPLLANLETDHALWLHFQNRVPEARACVLRSLKLVHGETAPQDFWGELLNLAASGGYLAEAKGGHATSLRVMAEWLPRLPVGFVLTQQLCDMALYTVQLGHTSKALALMEQAERCMNRAGNVTDAETFYYAVTRERVRLAIGDTLELSEGLLAQSPNDFQRIHVGLLWTQTLLYHGEKQAGSRCLSAGAGSDDAGNSCTLAPDGFRLFPATLNATASCSSDPRFLLYQ